MSGSVEGGVIEALARIRNERLGTDLMSAGMIRDLEVDPAGHVAFTFLLASDDSGALVQDDQVPGDHVPFARLREPDADPSAA